MRANPFALTLAVTLSALFAASCQSPKGDTAAQKRSYAQEMKKDALAELYKQNPQAKAHVQKAAGYAVFSNVGSKIFMLATGNGFGVATDNKTGKSTYMKMLEAGGGVGMGIKQYKAVYVFNSRAAFDSFVSGSWQAGGDADAGAAYQRQGMSAGAALTTDELAKPVTVYQFTESGVSFSAVATGTRFYPDDELN
jgi:lipid-binding SYLF domain-containing protein